MLINRSINKIINMIINIIKYLIDKLINPPITKYDINILSYFIKDIKDPSELAFYKQKHIGNIVKIFYKDELIYEISHYFFKPAFIWNYRNNIMKKYFDGSKNNYKIHTDNANTIKYLYYKQDNKLHRENNSFIYYSYIYTKYLQKIYIEYVIDNEELLTIKIKYYNGYKYIYNYNPIGSYSYLKYSYNLIFIMNKYELYYNNGFFNLFFGNN